MYILSSKNPSPVYSAITLSAVNKMKSQPIIGSIHTNLPIDTTLNHVLYAWGILSTLIGGGGNWYGG